MDAERWDDRGWIRAVRAGGMAGGGAMIAQVRHTPGPWIADFQNTHFGWSIEINRPELTGSIALVDGMRGDMQEANARLIASAPDLLEALRLIAQDGKDGLNCQCVALDWYGEGHTGECPVGIAEFAIAKAEGIR